jgi:hypothetical protein
VSRHPFRHPDPYDFFINILSRSYAPGPKIIFQVLASNNRG